MSIRYTREKDRVKRESMRAREREREREREKIERKRRFCNSP